MKPIAIFRHSITEGPGYFATHLDSRDIAWREIKIDQGEPVPDNPNNYSGLVFMGGPMSVNDPLAWIPKVLDLINAAVTNDVPVLGHCLGGQLISKALGGVVSRNAVKEIGWGRVEVADSPEARSWLGELRDFESFHWHGETFSIPAGAINIAASEHCAHQAFVLGKHLAMQCHVEMTPSLIRAWCEDWHKEVASLSKRVPSVQAPDEILRDVEARTERLNGIARALYERWLLGLKIDS
ncbi:MAG: type 1 glutamine amidotransferase [Burkholderiales bacterium]